jgi:hypothetical protein
MEAQECWHTCPLPAGDTSCQSLGRNNHALSQQSHRTTQLQALRATKCLRDENSPLLL